MSKESKRKCDIYISGKPFFQGNDNHGSACLHHGGQTVQKACNGSESAGYGCGWQRLDRALIWGGRWTRAVQHIPGILRHTWHPQAAFTISPQGCVVCWALKNTEKEHSRIRLILVPVLSSFEATFSLWYEYVVALLLLFICMALAAVPSCLPVDSAQPACTLARYRWVHERLSHHGTLTVRGSGRVYQVKSSWCQDVACLVVP